MNKFNTYFFLERVLIVYKPNLAFINARVYVIGGYSSYGNEKANTEHICRNRHLTGGGVQHASKKKSLNCILSATAGSAQAAVSHQLLCSRAFSLSFQRINELYIGSGA